MSIVSTIVRHAPRILKGAAIIGVGVTAYTAHQDAKRAYKIIDDAEFERADAKEDPLTMLEKIQLSWKCYIPTAASVVATGLAIYGLYNLNLRHLSIKRDVLLGNLDLVRAQLNSSVGEHIHDATLENIKVKPSDSAISLDEYSSQIRDSYRSYSRARTFLSPIGALIGLASSVVSATFNIQNKLDRDGIETFEDLKTLQWSELFNLFALDAVGIVWSMWSTASGVNRVASSAVGLADSLNHQNEQMVSSYLKNEKFIEETFGSDKLDELRSEVAEKAGTAEPTNTVYIAGEEVLIMDSYTGRVFKGNVTEIREAAVETNADALNDVYASLSDFWDRIGLDPTFDSDEVGWSASHLLQLTFEPMVLEGKRPALLMEYETRPFGRLSDVR